MVRPPCVDSNGMKKGAWSEEEDDKLRAYVSRYGHWNWRLLPKYAGLARCGKSCRLRWVNYLKPGVKKGNFTKEEEDLIVNLHARLGNKWSAIATKLPGRTDNEIKNFYHTRIDRHRKRNPSSKKVPEASYDDTQLLKEEKPLESAIPEATISQDDQLITQPKVDIFQIDTDYSRTDSFPLLMEDEFDQYPELHYSELSCSGSGSASYRSALDWIADDDHGVISAENAGPSVQLGSLWNECSETDYQNLSPTGFYDPLFQECFDYEMDLFS